MYASMGGTNPSEGAPCRSAMSRRVRSRMGPARAVVVTLLASGQVPPLQATLFDIESLAGRRVLHRFWGTACRHNEVVYLILFINERWLVLPVSE